MKDSMAASGEPLPWRQLATKPIYDNPWISVREDQALMPNGRTTVYGVITTTPAVGVLGFVDDDHVVMVRQWRYVAGRAMWEIPTGAAHMGEALEEAACREMIEETGYRVVSLQLLTSYHSSKSVMDETCTLYLGTDLTLGTARPDPTEFIRVEVLPFHDVLAMVLSGEIKDAMTVIAVLLAGRQRSGR
jgi:8-oxo-dGTP pyrophosphatase MutT (NUDIX family)